MSECPDLDAFLDGSLSPQQRADFEWHLNQCEACQQQVELESQLDQLLQEAWAQVTAPSGIGVPAQRLAPAGTTSANGRRGARRWIVLLSLAASLLLATWIGWQHLLDRDQPGANSRNPAGGSPLETIANNDSTTESRPVPATRNPVVFYPGAAKSSIVIPEVDDAEFTIVSVYEPARVVIDATTPAESD